jgi:fumarylacetoacetase
LSVVDLPPDSGYGLDHLPFGVFAADGDAPRVGVRVGDLVLDVAAAAAADGLPEAGVFAEPSLNAFLALGRERWTAARAWLTDLLTQPANAGLVAPLLRPLEQVRLHLPIEVADYVDFYASEHHAGTVGRIFRPDGPPLTPNWRHLPIGYHGRAGTVVVSGTDVVRPCGQRKPHPDQPPTYGPSTRLDIEAEVGFVVGAPSRLGAPVPVGAFAEHVFGVLLLNDWSARDVQAWEYVPLGPFLGKSFATSVSAWVTPLDALAAARVPLPAQQPTPLPYLRAPGSGPDLAGLDLAIEVDLNGSVISRPPFATMYWSPAQLLAHLTANGAGLRTGDLFASGTVSGPERTAQAGSLLELTWNGTQPLSLLDDARRGFLQDGDTVVLRATAPGTGGGRIALGEVTGTIRPPIA